MSNIYWQKENAGVCYFFIRLIMDFFSVDSIKVICYLKWVIYYQRRGKMNPEEYEPWQKALMSAVGQKCDWTDRAYLEPLIEYIRDEDE